MEARLIARSNCRKRKAVSAVIGGIILFGMIFTIAFGYFYTVQQDQQIYQAAARQSNTNTLLRNSENIYITGGLIGGNLTIGVNNTGIPVILVAYFLINQTGQIIQYKTGNPTTSTPAACPKTGASLPCALNQGNSTSFNTKIGYVTGKTYTMKVVTSRSNTFVGTYPTQQLTSYSVNSVVASGIGSLEMIFSSFDFYNYTNTNYNQVNLAYPNVASISPFNVPLVFSVQVTNNDPSSGTIIVNSHTNLWIFASCGKGCGSQSIIFFYVMNVAANGTITSQNQGSFTPIQIPYGQQKTLYFGSSADLSLGSYGYQLINDSIGEHDVFLILSGSKITPTNSTLYSQNLPFTATFAADNLASFSQTPAACSSGSSVTFTLNVNNLQWSSEGINKVVVQAAPFTPSSATGPWGAGTIYPNGTIIWSTASNYIMPKSSGTFTWTATAPVANGTQYTFLSTVYYYNNLKATVISQPINTGCYVS